MEQHPGLPSLLGHRPVWLVFFETASQWRQLLADRDWNELIEEGRQPFGLFTVCPDPADEEAAWPSSPGTACSGSCGLLFRGEPHSRVLEDLFDDAYLRRHAGALPAAEPLTASADQDRLEDEFEVFLAYLGGDLRRRDDHVPPTEWVRVALIVGQEAWLHRLRAAIAEIQGR